MFGLFARVCVCLGIKAVNESEGWSQETGWMDGSMSVRAEEYHKECTDERRWWAIKKRPPWLRSETFCLINNVFPLVSLTYRRISHTGCELIAWARPCAFIRPGSSHTRLKSKCIKQQLMTRGLKAITKRDVNKKGKGGKEAFEMLFFFFCSIKKCVSHLS